MSRRPPYVKEYPDRHGKLRRYFRRKGRPETPLPLAPYSSQEFRQAYAAALSGDVPELRKPQDPRILRGSVDDLVTRYYAHAEFQGLKPTSKTTYRGIIDRWRESLSYGRRIGGLPVALMERKHVDAMIQAKSETPTAANNLLRIIGQLMRFAIYLDMRANNPAANVKKIRHKSGGFESWTNDDVKRFEKRWAGGSMQRLALALALYTGQRRGDLVSMGRQHLDGGGVWVVQEKTGARLWIPLHPALKHEIDLVARDRLTFLTTSHGKPFAAAGFGNWFRDASRSAGVRKPLHGLRKAAAVRLVEAGCTVKQVAAISGHETLKEIERYTKAASQPGLAEAAMRTLLEHEVSNPIKKLDNLPDNALKQKEVK